MAKLNEQAYKNALKTLKGANNINELLVDITDTIIYKIESYIAENHDNRAIETSETIVSKFCNDILKQEYAHYIKSNFAKLLKKAGILISEYDFIASSEPLDITETKIAIRRFHSTVDKGLVINDLRAYPREQKAQKVNKKKPISKMSAEELIKDTLTTLKARLAKRDNTPKACLDFAWHLCFLADEQIKTPAPCDDALIEKNNTKAPPTATEFTMEELEGMKK